MNIVTMSWSVTTVNQWTSHKQKVNLRIRQEVQVEEVGRTDVCCLHSRTDLLSLIWIWTCHGILLSNKWPHHQLHGPTLSAGDRSSSNKGYVMLHLSHWREVNISVSILFYVWLPLYTHSLFLLDFPSLNCFTDEWAKYLPTWYWADTFDSLPPIELNSLASLFRC